MHSTLARTHRSHRPGVLVVVILVVLQIPALVQAGVAAGAQWPRLPAASEASVVKTSVLATFLGNLSRTSYNSDPSLTTASVSSLRERWVVHAGSSINAEPVVHDGVIYWGDWGGYETASNATTGRLIWRDFLGITVGQKSRHCSPPKAGVASSASLADVNGALRLIVGTGDGGIASINAANGKVVWKRRIAPKLGGMVWSSPAVLDGSVFIGVSSLGDCPLVPGKMIKLNAATGAVQATFTVSLPKGCSGDTMWSAPSIDPSLHALFITTGNSNTNAGTNCYTKDDDAILKLSTNTLQLEARWQVPKRQQYLDADFGATATLFQARLGGHVVGLVGAANKDGVFYALRQSNLAPVWSLRIAKMGNCPDCGMGTIASAAYDGTDLYLGATRGAVGTKKCGGSLRKVNPANGHVVWTLCLYDPVLAAPTALPGMVLVTYGPQLNVIATANKKTLFSFFDPTKNALQWATVAISGTWIYVPDMSGGLRAFQS